VQEAIARDADFAPFLASCQRITEYYIETRYPIGIHTLLQPETVQADLKTICTLSKLIRHFGSSHLREQADQPSRQSAVHHSFRLIGRVQLPIGETKTTLCRFEPRLFIGRRMNRGGWR
jgi:hypothetical protein